LFDIPSINQYIPQQVLMRSSCESMSGEPQSIKHFLSNRYAEITLAHRNGAGGFATCQALTSTMDEAIRSTYEMVTGGVRDEIAILALGGYGRKELCPHSDVDVMVLCPAGADREEVNQAAKTFLHLLWDAGMTVGHSVRTIDEVLETRGSAIESWASVLEGRFICGKQKLADRLNAAMREAITTGRDRWFIESVLEDNKNRHIRFGNSVKLLEPNVKKSAGGLRDIHTAMWLFRSCDSSFFLPAGINTLLTIEFLDQLNARGAIDAEGLQAAKTAYEFLLRVRHSMHYRRNALHDTLEYALQLEVAEELGYGSKAELRSVEVFMREYYLHARSIHRLHQRLTNVFAETQVDLSGRGGEGEKVGEFFTLRNDRLGLWNPSQRFDQPRAILEAFAHVAELDVEMDMHLRVAIERAVELITPDVCADEVLAALFRRIIRSQRVARTLGEMNELGILGKYIPEFGELVAFFQHNVYHYFTADEHTLVAVANAERLRDQQGVLREVFRNLKRKDILYMTLLLHDIGKPKGVGNHEVTGVEMSRAILERLGMQEMFDEVAFLVRNHLTMEQIAFRRNIHDPETIKEFAARFNRPELLDYLYLLTYADLSAVNVNVWTEWKASILQDLYLRTCEVLRRNLKGGDVDAFHQSKREAVEVGIVDSLSSSLPRETIVRHLKGIQSDAYTAIFAEEEIARHIEKSEADETVSTLFSHSGGYTEITIIAQDAPFALSRFCAVLAANDANIFDANIFTRNDGIIIDRFRVSEATSKKELDPGVCRKIADDLAQVMEGKVDVQHLFEAHHRRWKRRPKLPANPNVRIDVEFEDNPRYTIMDVYAPDSVGFLYRITETISRLALDIHFAKIATRVDGIVDAFYVLDRAAKPVTDPARREMISSEVLKTIRSLQEQELA
jgi:[protein-PII] uridylyltransferase